MFTLKCVVMGDGTVGKTSLLIRYAKHDFPTGYVPTIFDHYSVSVSIQGIACDLHLFDTAGQEDLDQLRRLALVNTDIMLVCCSVDFWASFENVRDRWIPELQKYCPGVPYILVGTKIDLRTDQKTIEKLAQHGRQPISKVQGEEMAKKLRAVKYVECSALTNENVKDVFQEAIMAAHNYHDNRPSSSKPKVQGTVESAQINNNNSNNNNVQAPQENNSNCCCNTQNCTIS